MGQAGLPLPPEFAAAQAAASESTTGTDWNKAVEALGQLARILERSEAEYSSSLRTRVMALASWAGEPSGSLPALDGQLRAALASLAEGDVATAGKKANALIEETLPKVVARRTAAREAGRSILTAARELGVSSESLESALRADAEALPVDWQASVEAVESTGAQVGETLRTRVAATLDSLRATLESVREYGVDPTEALTQIGELAGSVPTVPPQEVPAVLGKARAITEEPVVGIVAGLLDAVRPKLVEARRMGRDASDVFATMNRAREALRLKIYSEALAASQEAVDRVSSLTGDLETAKDEADSLAELLDRLGKSDFPIQRFVDAQNRIQDLLGRVELEPARSLLAETLRTLGSEAAQYFTERWTIVEGILPTARERNFLPEGIEGDLAKVKRELDEGQIADAGEGLSAIEVKLRTAAEPIVSHRVEELEQGFEDIPDEQLVAPVRRLLADADVNLRVKGDLAASLESLKRAEKEFTSVFAAHASALVEILEEERRTLESMGGAGDEIQRQIDEVQQIFNMGDFVKASRASQEIRTRAHQQQLLRSEDALSHAKLALVELGKMGVEAPALKVALDQAGESARGQRYAESYAKAAATQEAAVRMKTTAQALLDGLGQANQLYAELKQAGVAAEAHREKIRLAQVAYQALDFDGAKETLEVLMALMRSEKANAETRRLLSESDLLREDGHRLSLATEAPEKVVQEARAALDDGRSAEALQKARSVHAELVQLIKPVLTENLRTVEQDLEIARAAGLEIAPVVETVGEARRRLGSPVPLGVAELLESGRSRLIETRGFHEHAERALKRAGEALGQAELVHVNVPDGRTRFAELEGALKRREYARSVELASTLEREMIQLTYQQVSKTLAGFQAVLVRARQDGGDTSVAENLLMQARQALEEGRPLDGLQLAARSEAELERVELQIRIAQASLKTMQHKLAEAVKEGITAKVAHQKITEAEGAYRDHLYPIVLELAIDASDSLSFTRDSFRRSKESLDSADRQVKEAMELGADAVEVVPILEGARAAEQAGDYPEATRKGREAAEVARWAIERLYTGALSELRVQSEAVAQAGIDAASIGLAPTLQAAEVALQSREWRNASELLQKGRDAARQALDARLDARLAELDALYRALGDVAPAELAFREGARTRVNAERARGGIPQALSILAEEEGRTREVRRRDLQAQVAAFKERLWVGEKLGLDTTPVMELFSEAQLHLQSGQLDRVAPLLADAEGKLRSMVSPRLEDRIRETQTELVFAQDGLHVALNDVMERFQGIAELAPRSPVEAAQQVLQAGEELNRRKALHRELMNLHYLIDAALGRAAERHLETAEARKLLDESIRLRATDYPAALDKAREALRTLQGLLERSDGGSSGTFWPFRRPPGT
jgi:hypothetical protein